jgi:hypothetical protein
MKERKEKCNERPCHNPNLLVTGGFAALGGLLIYALIARLLIVWLHLK